MTFKAVFDATMRKKWIGCRAADLESKPPVFLAGRQHLLGEILRENAIGLPIERKLNRNAVTSYVRRRCPQARSSHFRIGVRTSGDRPLPIVRRRGFRLQGRGKRLLVGSVLHPDGSQYGVLHQLWKRLFGYVSQKLLHHRIAASRVTPFASRLAFQTNRRIVGGLLPMQHLEQSGHRVSARVSRDAMSAEA